MSIVDVEQKISDVYSIKYKRDIKEIRTTSNNRSSIVSKPVKYSIQKIIETDFCIQGNMTLEIERTMDLCEKVIVSDDEA